MKLSNFITVQDATGQPYLKEAANLLNIVLLDHVIVNRNGYFSFMESGIL